MQSIIVSIIAAIFSVGYFYLWHTPVQVAELSPEQSVEMATEQPKEPLSETKKSPPTKTQVFLGSVKSAVEPSIAKPTILIDTYITSGPKEGEVIEDKNQVTFGFEATVSPETTQNRIIFETKVEGFDKNWQETSSKQRVIILPVGSKEYTFWVRAKINNVIDKTSAGRTFKINISPYFGKVKISSADYQTSSRPSLVTLNTYLGEEKINITGWQIRGKRGIFIIPGGIENYNPYYNPVPDENIIAKRGDTIYLSGAANPLGRGRNFRPNKCLGYLTNYYNFPISLPLNCPKAKSEEISHLNPCCQEFILKLGSCKIADYSNNLKISTDPECVAYLNENFNYAGCYIKYSQDKDFIWANWHIYMNTNIVVSDDCDTLYLRDQNGLLVDKYSYGRSICR